MEGRLRGICVLVVEDDPIIALDLVQTLSDAGAVVLGPAHTVAVALDLLDQTRPNLAVLDWRLEIETASPVAFRLKALSVPFLFHTSSRSYPEAAHPGVPVIDKPTRPEQFINALNALTRRD
jgi:DNA-binding response OmpR family regulator